MLASFVKNSAALLDYSIDWTSWLDSDSISSSTWVISSGLTKTDETHTDEVATVWLSGGMVDRTYDATNYVTTASGRRDHRYIQIVIKNI